MFRKYVDTLSLQDHDALTHHERPRTIVHNNIFGGEGAKRFQPQDSITLFFVSKFCSVIDRKCIRDIWNRGRGQEGSSWCLAVIVVDKQLASPARRTTIPATLQTQAEIASAEGRSHWESYVVAAIFKVRTRSRVGWLSKDVKGRRKVRRKGM